MAVLPPGRRKWNNGKDNTRKRAVLRDGWRTILNRTDTLAAECARLGKVLGATRYFTGSCQVTVDMSSRAQAEQWASRLQPSPRTALATYLGNDRERDILIDPVTDMPAVRASRGTIETVAPQRLPAHSPLAALTIGLGSTPRHRLSSYTAKNWHAQLSQLTATHRGQQALEDAGLHVTTKTLINWLSDAEYNVRRNYRDLIHTAYENTANVPADPIPDHIKRGQYEISGIVRTGDDERERGTRDAAPLRIDGSRGPWDEIEGLWLAGELIEEEFEDHFIDDVIVEDIGEGTDGWGFPGASYSVEVR